MSATFNTLFSSILRRNLVDSGKNKLSIWVYMKMYILLYGQNILSISQKLLVVGSEMNYSNPRIITNTHVWVFPFHRKKEKSLFYALIKMFV